MAEDNKNKVSRPECRQNMDIIMLKVEKKLMEQADKISQKFNETLEKAKKSLASEQELNDARVDIKTLKEEFSYMKKIKEQRSYDWLKYAITTAIMLLIAKTFS